MIQKQNDSIYTKPKILTYLLFAWKISKMGFYQIKITALTAVVLRGMRGDMALCSSVLLGNSKLSLKNLSIMEDQDFFAKLMTAQYVFAQSKVEICFETYYN